METPKQNGPPHPADRQISRYRRNSLIPVESSIRWTRFRRRSFGASLRGTKAPSKKGRNELASRTAESAINDLCLVAPGTIAGDDSPGNAITVGFVRGPAVIEQGVREAFYACVIACPGFRAQKRNSRDNERSISRSAARAAERRGLGTLRYLPPCLSTARRTRGGSGRYFAMPFIPRPEWRIKIG